MTKNTPSSYNKFCKAPSHHNLVPLRLEGEPSDKRTATNTWIETIQDVLQTNSKTNGILDDYPVLPDNIPTTVNEALGSFLRANVAHHVKNMLNDVDAKDGMGILLRIQEIYAPASTKDRNEALAYLNDLQMHPKDTITNFIQKFQRALKILADVSIGTPTPDLSHTINLFIQKCLRTVPEGSDLRQLCFSINELCAITPQEHLCLSL